MDLQEHTDYRAWLKQRAEELKKEKPYFSYRFLAAKLGINAGMVARVLNAQIHLPLEHVAKTSRLFGLEGVPAQYFEELVRFGRAKNQKEADRHFQRLQALRGMAFRPVADTHLEYYNQWYHGVLRSLLSIHTFRGQNHRRLGALLEPAVDAESVRKSLDLLERSGLAVRDEDGAWRVPDRLVSTGDGWKGAAIRSHQREMIRLSERAVDEIPREERDVSSLTLPFSASLLEVARERLRAFRQEMLALSGECEKEDRIYQLNLQFFPVARLPPEAKP